MPLAPSVHEMGPFVHAVRPNAFRSWVLKSLTAMTFDIDLKMAMLVAVATGTCAYLSFMRSSTPKLCSPDEWMTQTDRQTEEMQCIMQPLNGQPRCQSTWFLHARIMRFCPFHRSFLFNRHFTFYQFSWLAEQLRHFKLPSISLALGLLQLKPMPYIPIYTVSK